MSGLLGLLDLGAGAMVAQNAGVAVAARNTANVNTVGYSRQRINLQSELGVPLVGGVRVEGPERFDDQLLSLRERTSDSSRGQYSSLSVATANLEAGVAPSQGNMVQAIAALFGGLLDLASSPLDPALRTDVVSRANDTATAFTTTAGAISSSRSQTNARIQSMAREAERLASQVAAANRALAVDHDPVIADKRDQAARGLAEIIGSQARIDSDGQMRIVVPGGGMLVDGGRSAQIVGVPDSTTGDMRIELRDGNHVDDVTNRITGGKIGGEIAFRDQTLTQASTELDQLAFDMATQINAVHRNSAAPDGTTGLDLFDEPAQVAGTAAAFSVNAQIATDASKLAGATFGAGAGDNSGFLQLVALKDQPVAGNGTRTFVDQAITMLGNVGAAAASTRGAHELELARSEVLAGLRDGLSGVSLAEEASNLSQYQHASEAAVRFIGTVDQMLDFLITNL